MTPKEAAYDEIAALVERFTDQFQSYKKAEYNETLTRRDFIDPFFQALGWDIDNKNGYAEAYREVIHEDRVKVGKATKAPDYSFRLSGGKRLFFVEAKKPSVFVKDDIQPAYQVRRYGWSAKLPISIITDFEEFAIYDCTKKPNPGDKASVARIKYILYTDYLKEFDFLWDTFSKERVLKGSFDKFVESSAGKKGTATVDKEFLISLDTWRTYLATSISWNNKNLDEDEINYVVQQTLDRIIFLRIAEDRGVEPYGNLKNALKQGDYYQNLLQIFQIANDKYNSGLFDFKKDSISRSISIPNKVFKSIFNELYYPVSPYEFSVLSVEILGSAYEQFLGKQIRIDKGHHAHIEEKPEVRKAGGVYYTPEYVVEYIVKNTVGKLITEQSTPETVSPLRIVDPACGSGSFLIGAYQFLLDWHKDYYNRTLNRSKGGKNCPLTPDGNLTTAEKKRILLNNIYGVDIDVNAVEVTKLSLLLKCMEGETEASIANQLSLFNERVLPTLDSNIKSGNSLVDTDFYDNQLDFGEEKKIKPFNWQKAFPEVFKPRKTLINPELKQQYKRVFNRATENELRAKELVEKLGGRFEEPEVLYEEQGGFDVVIGNPPYVRQELLGNLKSYYQQNYRVYHGMADLYSYFIERSMQLLRPEGLYGVIVANKWMRANYGEPLRKWLKTQNVKGIIDFGDLPVFEQATTYPCIMMVEKSSVDDYFATVNVKTLKFLNLTDYVLENSKLLEQKSLEDKGWNLGSVTENDLLKKLDRAGVKLKDYVQGKIYRGVLTGLNEAFVIDRETKDRLILEDPHSAEVIKPFLGGRDIKRFQPLQSDKYLIFTKRGININEFLAIKEYLIGFKKQLEPKPKDFKGESWNGRKPGNYKWYEIQDAVDYYLEFERPKIMLPDIALKMQATYDSRGMYCVNTAYIIPVDDKYLLGLLNSNVVHYYYTKISSSIRGGYLRFIRQYLETIPLPESDNSNDIIQIVDQILLLHEEKKKANLSSKIDQIESKIEYCENRINQIVYQLYELTEEEIKIVEGN